MAIHGLYGVLGSGKSTTANLILQSKSNKGKTIISHCDLNMPYERLTIYEIFDKAISDTKFFTDKVLFMDEFHLIMESRRSTAGVNVDFSQSILIQLGKLDCDLIYTSQLLSQMDLRIKEMQKYFYFCNKEYRIEGMPINIYNKIDWDARIPKHPITKMPIPCDIEVEYWELVGVRKGIPKYDTLNYVLPYEMLVNIFNRFNTREIIKFDRKKYLRK